MAKLSASHSAFWRVLALGGAVIALAGLTGCGAIDDALFSGSETEATPGEPAASTANNEDQNEDNGTAGALAPELGTTVTRIPIAEGQPTGTAVGQKVQELRTTLMDLQNRIEANGQRLSSLRASEAAYASSYNGSKSQITSRLQLGTTRGNPELVAQWNTAQDSLDRIAADINALNALGSDVGADDAQAHFALDTIRATYGVSGAVDEDHRQLSMLEDETSQSIVLIERLLTNVAHDVQRETSYVANERSNLTVLANAIKNGEIYGAALGPSMMATSQPAMPRGSFASSMVSGTPLVVIKFDRPNVEYQQILYTALAQALERRPEAGFQVVAVAPTAGSATSLQLTQSETQRNAQAVLRSMSDMGVPANRLALSSTTDPGVQAGEVRVYMR